MVKMTRTPGRAMITAHATMPTGPDDPRLMSIEDITDTVHRLLASDDDPAPPRGLEDIHEQVWAKHNRAPAQASAGEFEQDNARGPGDRQKPAPKSLDDIRDAAWARFNGRAR